MDSGVVAIINSSDKLQLIVKSKGDKDASKILKNALAKVGGNGGGNPSFAQGGAQNATADALLDAVKGEL